MAKNNKLLLGHIIAAGLGFIHLFEVQSERSEETTVDCPGELPEEAGWSPGHPSPPSPVYSQPGAKFIPFLLHLFFLLLLLLTPAPSPAPSCLQVLMSLCQDILAVNILQPFIHK